MAPSVYKYHFLRRNANGKPEFGARGHRKVTQSPQSGGEISAHRADSWGKHGVDVMAGDPVAPVTDVIRSGEILDGLTQRREGREGF